MTTYLQETIGYLEVQVTSTLTNRPIPGARIRVYQDGFPQAPIDTFSTDNGGRAPTISLPAPPEAQTESPSVLQPYSLFNAEISAPTFASVVVTGIQILSGSVAILPVSLLPALPTPRVPEAESYVIGPHTLFGDYPPKIPETEIKSERETGEVVLSQVVVPETIVVHDGPPSDSSAKNYYVPYADYIKNVASSEIYATWPMAAIEANVLAIQSFTLNRVYTEWYRSKGYSFTITSSTAYDHKWIPGRNIYDSIEMVVDRLFHQYVAKPSVSQPLLTQYCDGKNVTCPGWMTQWGSKYLADQEYTALDILKNYYGNDIYLGYSNQVQGIPSSWPGVNLTIGSTGSKVQQLQAQLNVIGEAYPSIPSLAEDGVFGPVTEESVTAFQRAFRLPANGVVDYPTWYKISQIYVGVSRIAELR